MSSFELPFYYGTGSAKASKGYYGSGSGSATLPITKNFFLLQFKYDEKRSV